MNDNTEYYLMDETDIPYEEGQTPYQRTIKDDLLLIKFAKDNSLELKNDGPLYVLQNKNEPRSN